MASPRTSPLRKVWPLLKETGEDFVEDNVTRLAAALAYYTLLSLAPLVVLSIAIAGFVADQETTRGRLAAELGAVVGPSGEAAVRAIVENARTPSTGILSTIVGVVVLLFGASGVFGELQ
ncbi:MAG TPA: YhjD/YihY/BrkB family envelope integrity protein, partial [Polyangiaceae bacterium]